MKLEALNLFSTFSSPVLRTQNALKDQNGKPLIPELPELNPTDVVEAAEKGCGLARFSPYPAKLPWHSGRRGVFSRLFPRYGNYCGPNWSSGRESGSLIWDKAPVDALDYCCYHHDMGYDSYEQSDLHKADLEFLNCLERIVEDGRRAGDSPVSEPYRNMYIVGLRTVLIPYRKFLLQRVDEVTRKKLAVKEVGGEDTSNAKHMS